MSKIFLILAILAAGAAAFVANENKATFADVHQGNKDLDAEISQLKRDNTAEETAIEDARSELAESVTKRDDAEASRDYRQQNLSVPRAWIWRTNSGCLAAFCPTTKNVALT